MQHTHFYGTHYEIGFQYGSMLAERGQFLLRNVPFPITQIRRDFADACLPVYRKHFPEILEEIQGVADGQHCETAMLHAVLFGMYALPPACGCSCFAVSNGQHVLLGRNSDFLVGLEHLNTNAICKFSTGSSYDFTGNTTAFLEMEDVVNACGLVAGLTSVPVFAAKPGFHAGMLLRFFLEKCRDTEEVIQCIEQLPIASAQTFAIADAKGSIAVIECLPGSREIFRPADGRPFVFTANRFRSKELAALQSPEADTWHSDARLKTMESTLLRNSGDMDIPSAMALLSGKNGFMCQYDRLQGMDTAWSVLYDLKKKEIFRAEGNPGRVPFKQDGRFPF